MRSVWLVALTAVMAVSTVQVVSADPWKDESGKHRWRGDMRDGGRYHAREYKEEFRSGGCKVERKWDKKGYKEEIKCERR